ncbi:MAG: 50S ribosomal protein L6 [Alphaproteobacteria bacterium]|nr:50S ribosomal protein L6 [Alphaproteobacteria bacterium]MBN2780222.1 50S ribosomal protein L6 [Alphaproteobacteria bacterium]
MSRVGKLPVVLKDGVTVALNGDVMSFKGKNGTVDVALNSAVKVEQNDTEIVVTPVDKENTFSRAMWGTMRSLLNNANIGVSEGFKQELEFKGVGYKVQVQGQTLKMTLGFSHDVDFELPETVKAEAQGPAGLLLTSASKRDLGQIVREIQKYRPPEPYKGKGIHIKGAFVRRKEGKKK